MTVAPLNLTRFDRTCHPPTWARGPHLQTILGNYLPSVGPEGVGEERLVDLGDGDRLRGEVWAGTSDTVVLIFHGLGGSTEAPYVRRTLRWLQGAGHTGWAFNHRGCGSGRGLAAQPYHSGRADDVGAVIGAARAAHPDHRILAIGYSLSGNALLLNLGEGIGVFPKPDAAIAVNPPVDLRVCADLLGTGFNRLYDIRFIKRCLEAVRQREEDGLIPKGSFKPRWWRDLQTFDDDFTAPAGGFQDRFDYYARCSAGPHLANITTPTVILQSADDPFVAAQGVIEAPKSDAVFLHLEATGGHMGYLDATIPDRRWMDEAVSHYLEELRVRLGCQVQARSSRLEAQEITEEPAFTEPQGSAP